MDKYEYKLKNDEIKSLIRQREFQKAVELADTIDWTRVRSVNTLCQISDLYKINRRYRDAKALLEQAYERYPNGRMIVFSLCELCIKMEEIVQAIEYYKQFVQMAPTDNNKFILQYKIYEAQEVSLEERIAVLEELKKREYKEKWGYELAYLYHRIGLTTKCVEECDELILWFREGTYVKKAMELKMLHQQLTDSQMDIYQSMLPPKEKEEFIRQNTIEMPAAEPEDDIRVKTMDMSKYNTLNLQKELAESMKEVLVADNGFAPLIPSNEEGNPVSGTYIPDDFSPERRVEPVFDNSNEHPGTTTENISRTLFRDDAPIFSQQPIQNPGATGTLSANMHDTGEMEEIIFSDDEDNLSEPAYNPEYSNEEAAPYDPVKDLELTMMYNPENISSKLDMEEISPDIDEEAIEEAAVPKVGSNTAELIGLDDTVEIIEPMEATKIYNREELNSIAKAYTSSLQADSYGFDFSDPSIKQPHTELEDYISEDIGDRNKEELLELIDKRVQEAIANALNMNRMVPPVSAPLETVETGVYSSDKLPSEMEQVLSQDYDGQISLVVPDAPVVEKQITGQMSIDDILNEWENTKKQQQAKFEQHVAKKVLEETGSLFANTESLKTEGLFERLERNETLDGEVDTEAEYEKYLEQLMAEEAELAKKEEISETQKEAEVAKAAAEAAIAQAEEAKLAAEEAAEAASTAQAEADTNVEEQDPVEDNDEVEELTDIEEQPIAESEENLDDAEDIAETEKPIEEKPVEEETIAEVPLQVKLEEPQNNFVQTASSAEADEKAEVDENRSMNDEELSLFAQFAQTKRARQNLLHSLDKISLAAYTGNVFVTGETTEESLELAKNVIRYVKNTDGNFTGKIAKVSGEALNNKMISVMVEKLANGGLIIEKASGMSAETTKDLLKALNQEKTGIVVALQDSKKNMHKMMEHFNGMKQIFNIHIEVEELSDDALVAYGKKYAEHLEYSIDDMGILALHQRIDELQTSDHIVTVSDVRDILDEAIEKANKKSLKHFTDVLFAKRYDEEDMIILRENDFIG